MHVLIVNAIKSYKGVENAVQSMGEGPSSGFKLKHAIESTNSIILYRGIYYNNIIII